MPLFRILTSMLTVALRGIRTEGPMAPEIALENQRPAAYVHSLHVEAGDRSGRK